jgi:hypothetical protein
MTNEKLTAIYNEANGLDPKRHNPITTERIFTAMRAMGAMALEEAADWFNAPEQDAWEIAEELRDMADKMRSNGEVRGASRPAGEASSGEAATSTVLLGAGAPRKGQQ